MPPSVKHPSINQLIMEPLYIIVSIIVQPLLFLFIFSTILFNYNLTKNAVVETVNLYVIVEILVFILLGLCFVYYQISSFSTYRFFDVFKILILLCSVAYWAAKVRNLPQKIHFVLAVFIATFLWLSLLTCFKFLVYIPLVWFPFFGLTAVTPYLLCALILVNLITYTKNQKFNFWLVLFLGLSPLLLTYLGLSISNTNAIDFFIQFTPNSTVI